MAQDEFRVETGSSPSRPSYAFASPDGSHAFFQSVDRLTSDAPEDEAAKAYVFDLDSGALEYLPSLTGPIVAMSRDGSSLVFENTAQAPSSFELERWTAGPGGGHATPIAPLLAPSNGGCGSVLCVSPAFMSSDGKTVVFATDSPIAGFNDGGTHYEREERLVGEQPIVSEGTRANTEVFRYEAADDTLDCLSCPPNGVVPSSDAILSTNSMYSNSPSASGGTYVTDPGRSLSVDGSQVFFETREALVPQDTNGTSDVYEWEGGKLYLISSGHDAEPSHVVGVSESGGDAFFMTAEGIEPGDTDGSYDIYDARIPRPGDNPPEAIPCTGSVCQGPPSVPQLLGAPASAAFNGVGNPVPPPAPHIRPKSLTRTQKLARALKQCRRHASKRMRRRCERQARLKYKAKASRAHRAENRHHNGRGN
jgi:hypothetical protein